MIRKKLKLALLFALIILSVHQASACEICGCGVGNFYMGLLPNFKNKFVGVRYQFMRYATQVKGDPSQYSNDFYKTIEIWSGWNLGQKWQLMVFLPYQVNKQYTDDGIKDQHGLGDITLMGNYKVWQHRSAAKNNSLQKQEIWLGGGIKLPTGRYQLDLNNPDANLGDVNAQMGTGSVDFIANISHLLMMGRWGINSSANFKINTTNSNQYQFGNRFSANSFVFYHLKMWDINISPNAGMLYQNAKSNLLAGEKLAQTGGYAAFAAGGAEFSFRKFAAGINVQLPFAQNYADGQTKARPRGVAHITFTL